LIRFLPCHSLRSLLCIFEITCRFALTFRSPCLFTVSSFIFKSGFSLINIVSHFAHISFPSLRSTLASRSAWSASSATSLSPSSSAPSSARTRPTGCPAGAACWIASTDCCSTFRSPITGSSSSIRSGGPFVFSRLVLSSRQDLWFEFLSGCHTSIRNPQLRVYVNGKAVQMTHIVSWRQVGVASSCLCLFACVHTFGCTRFFYLFALFSSFLLTRIGFFSRVLICFLYLLQPSPVSNCVSPSVSFRYKTDISCFESGQTQPCILYFEFQPIQAFPLRSG
jgi:hypothetical protein